MINYNAANEIASKFISGHGTEKDKLQIRND